MSNPIPEPLAEPLPSGGRSVLVEAEDLHRSFGDTQAVRGVSFTLHEGEVIGFLGPNGAGKSTTLQMLAGALAPSSGRIAIDGIDLLDAPLAARTRVGFLPEQPPLYRELTVDEQLGFCAALHKLPRAQRRAAVVRARERTGLGDSGPRVIGNLSKGYQQRVGIAQTLVHDPAVVLLDEPTSGLDPNQLREIRELVRSLAHSHGVILSTHILSEVQAMCDRVLVMRRGEIVLDESLSATSNRAARTHLVRLRAEPTEVAIAALRATAGIDQVERQEERLIRVLHDGNCASVDAIATALGPFGLRELSPERDTLEQLFTSLTMPVAPATHGDAQEAAE